MKNNGNGDKLIEIETLKSSNYILEEKMKLLSQKLEISKKDCLEKENLLKKMAAFNNLNENDSHLFQNLTLELQKHTTAVNNFTQNDQILKNQHLFEYKKETFNEKPSLESPKKTEPKAIIKETPKKEPIIIKTPEIIAFSNEKQEIKYEIKEEIKIEKQQENVPIETLINESPKKSVDSPQRQEFQQLPTKNVIEEQGQMKNEHIEPPPPPPPKKKNEDTLLPKKNVNQNKNFAPTAFNHTKLGNKESITVSAPKIIEQKKLVSSKHFFYSKFLSTTFSLF